MGNERITDSPNISLRVLRGLDERTSPANLQPGTFDLLRGFYPGRTGLLQRIPPHAYLLDGNGNPFQFAGRMLGIHDTGNANGDILIQTTTGLYATTIDALLNRSTTPVLTPPPIQTEEEAMSCAIIVQNEASTIVGGSIGGWLSGTDNTTVIANFYSRRLTNLLVNENDYATGLVPTVAAFTAATGGAGAASTASTFELSPGTFRITGRFTFVSDTTTAAAFRIGLYNITSAGFEVYAGTATPILAAVVAAPSSTRNTSMSATLDAVITVASTNKVFQFSQSCSFEAIARALLACGTPGAAAPTVTPVGGAAAAPTNLYSHVKILRTA